MTSLDLDNSGALDFREFVALVRRLSRLPLLTRLFQKYNGDERYMSHEVFDTLWRREQASARARARARARTRARAR